MFDVNVGVRRLCVAFYVWKLFILSFTIALICGPVALAHSVESNSFVLEIENYIRISCNEQSCEV